MNSYEAFQLYTALKLHFNSSYDYFKYNGKVKITADQFQNRNDRYSFEKLAKHKDPEGLLLTAFLRDDYYIRVIIESTELNFYCTERQRRLDSITRTFQTELKRFEGMRPETIVAVQKNGLSPLLEAYLRNAVSAEVVAIMLHRFPGMDAYWEKELAGDPTWDLHCKKLVKYAPFMKEKYNKEKIDKILRETFFKVDIVV